MANLLLFDDVDPSLLPAGYDAYAGYVDGRYNDFNAIRARFPRAQVLSIDVLATNTSANCLDVEPGDATNASAVGWVKAKIAAKAKLIVLYTSASNVDALVDVLARAGIPRAAYKLWSAHYGDGEHVCGPSTCKLTKWACDGTQFTSRALGKSLDESVLNGDFFGPVPAPKPPVPGPVWPKGVVLKYGDRGGAVRVLQAGLRNSGIRGVRGISVDGDFGMVTRTSVRNFQAFKHLNVDGIAGPATRAALGV